MYICIGPRHHPSSPSPRGGHRLRSQTGLLLSFVKKGLQQGRASWQRSASSPQSALCFPKGAKRVRPSASSESIVIYLLFVHQASGRAELGCGLLDLPHPQGCGQVGPWRGISILPPPLRLCFTQARCLSLRASRTTVVHSVSPICVVRPIVPVGRVTDCLWELISDARSWRPFSWTAFDSSG